MAGSLRMVPPERVELSSLAPEASTLSTELRGPKPKLEYHADAPATRSHPYGQGILIVVISSPTPFLLSLSNHEPTALRQAQEQRAYQHPKDQALSPRFSVSASTVDAKKGLGPGYHRGAGAAPQGLSPGVIVFPHQSPGSAAGVLGLTSSGTTSLSTTKMPCPTRGPRAKNSDGLDRQSRLAARDPPKDSQGTPPPLQHRNLRNLLLFQVIPVDSRGPRHFPGALD